MVRNGDNTKLLIDSTASDFAFRVGQALEMYLIEQALKNAEQNHDMVITVDHVRASIDEDLFNKIKDKIRVGKHGYKRLERRLSA